MKAGMWELLGSTGAGSHLHVWEEKCVWKEVKIQYQYSKVTQLDATQVRISFAVLGERGTLLEIFLLVDTVTRRKLISTSGCKETGKCAAQGGGGVTIPGGVQERQRCGTEERGQLAEWGWVGVGLDDLNGSMAL